MATPILALALAAACNEQGNAPSAPEGDAGPVFDATYDGLPPLETTPPDPIPPDKRKDAVSAPVAFDWLRGGAWTANGDVGSITYADVDHQQVVAEVAVGQDIRSVALSPDGKWVAAVDRAGASVTLIDADSRSPRRTLALGTHPRAAVWDAWDPRWLYVSIEDDDAIAVIDRTVGAVVHEAPVGRIPAGLAVSRLRHEIAVTHRIDGKVTIAALDGVYSPADQGVAPVDVSLADEPFSGTDTVPSGMVFGLESLAWAPNGNVVWAPHELLANHHPFQFQRNLFPAVSVVDLSARAEVQTDPTDPTGAVAGRKDLFAAINVPDAVGNTSILSQPCAAAIHPNGLVAWVVACASEDLLTFDVVNGNATQLLRNLPGDHPAGMTLDDTGQRMFVLMDQSHSLLTLDTAGGSLVGFPRVIGGPLSLAAKDPVDPETRAGLKLFFGANSTKNPLPTTGNFWMSCGGCHLDGFVSTNTRFFEALHPADPTQDATIAHVGLADMFSTTPTPDDPSFNPHDVLAAMIDQGGLVPDRTGADRTGQIDPAHPTADAKLMAQRIARVVARDLPKGPSWQLAPGSKPMLTYDADWCGNCHKAEYAAWQKSAHAHAAQDVMVKYGSGVEQQLRGPQYSRQCAGCHDPVSLRAGDGTLTSGRGITCLGCHDAARLIRAGGNSDLEYQTQDWMVDHRTVASDEIKSKLQKPEFCAVCHQQFVPGTGLLGITTYTEWHDGPYSGEAPDGGTEAGQAEAGDDGGEAAAEAGADATTTDATTADASADASPTLDAGDAAAPTTAACLQCHVTDHSMPGGNVYAATTYANDPTFVTLVTKKLQSAIQLFATQRSDGVHVLVQNTGSGHAFPTGVTDIREPWVEVQALDGAQNVVARIGGPDANGLIPATAARFGMDIADADGGILLRHELTNATRIPFARFVPPLGQVEVLIPLPNNLPQNVAELDAVLLYRNVRTPYYRNASGDSSGHAPEVEVARAPAILGQ